MKNYIKVIFTIILFIFSIYYTNKGIIDLKKIDPLMKEIIDKSSFYEQEPIDAIITNQFMIPGNIGYKVNLNKSFNKMKKINTFDESLLVYDLIKPKKSINNCNKVIVNGNPYKNNISLLFKADDDTTSQIKNILKKKSTTGNFYNDLLNKYCFIDSPNTPCIDKKTILLKNNINKYHLSYTKNNLNNGNILFYTFTKKDVSSLELVINYVLNNHYKIVTIDENIQE